MLNAELVDEEAAARFLLGELRRETARWHATFQGCRAEDEPAAEVARRPIEARLMEIEAAVASLPAGRVQLTCLAEMVLHHADRRSDGSVAQLGSRDPFDRAAARLALAATAA